MEYQPRWVNGREVGEGIRKASSRYDAIAAELEGHRGFRVLDVGAYTGYFSLRLAEDFDATVTAVDSYRGLRKALTEAADPRVTGMYERLTPQAVAELGEYDVILCLSVLHHVPWWEDLLAGLRARARLLFIEVASPNEVLPKAVAHCPEIPAAVAAVEGARVIARTHGYRSRKMRPLYAVGGLD